MTVRTFAQCIGFGATSFSVVGDLLGYRKLRAVTVSAQEKVGFELVPGLPFPLQGDWKDAVEERVSLREHIEVCEGAMFALNVGPAIPVDLDQPAAWQVALPFAGKCQKKPSKAEFSPE